MNGYITLDYELGMGKITGTPEKCLVEPMNYLTSMTQKYGVKMNVFVDATYLLQLHKLMYVHPQLEKDYKTVINHIKKMDAEGHSIQLHLHPQWCHSKFDGEKWLLDMDCYKLSDMPLEEQKEVIRESVELLNSLTTHNVSAFRAGGYSLANFSELYDTFVNVGIVNDTSVLRGAYQKGRFQQYDYRCVPLKTSYRVVDNLTIEDTNGRMTEYPIATKFMPYVIHFFRKFVQKGVFVGDNPSKTRWGDGVGIGFPGNKFHQLKKQVVKFFSMVPVRASIDECYSFENVYSYSLKHLVGDDFVIIGHPKLISPRSVANLEQFIKKHSEIKFKLFCSRTM